MRDSLREQFKVEEMFNFKADHVLCKESDSDDDMDDLYNITLNFRRSSIRSAKFQNKTKSKKKRPKRLLIKKRA